MNTTLPAASSSSVIDMLRAVETAQTDAASLDNEALCLRALEMVADMGDGLVRPIVADQYVREMEKRGLT